MAPQHGAGDRVHLGDEQLVSQGGASDHTSGDSQHVDVSLIVWYHVQAHGGIIAVTTTIQHGLPDAVAVHINLEHCGAVVSVICQHIGIAGEIHAHCACCGTLASRPGRYLLLPAYGTAAAVQLYEIGALAEIRATDQKIAALPCCGNCVKGIGSACVQRGGPYQQIVVAVDLGYQSLLIGDIDMTGKVHVAAVVYLDVSGYAASEAHVGRADVAI